MSTVFARVSKASLVAASVTQRLLLRFSYFLFSGLSKLSRSSISNASLVVGVYEVASMVKNISDSIPGSVSVNLGNPGKEEFEYSHELPRLSKFFSPPARFVYGPILLGKLMVENHNFLYVGRLGFLNSSLDGRNWESSFLKSKGKNLICYLVGTDIRSPKKMLELEINTGEENIGTYQFAHLSRFERDRYEGQVLRFSSCVDAYSDATFTAKFDQASYLLKPTLPFLYFCPTHFFENDLAKFENFEKLIIVHAPTNPTIKGTNLVRAAIRRLELEGFVFEYREIHGVSNQDLQKVLKGAHILLNEFYGFMPGVLAIEGLAKSCVVLTRADYRFETDLGPESAGAWVVTPPYMIYENLKVLLENPQSLRAQAEKGFIWAQENAAASLSARKIRSVIESLNS